MNAVAFSIVGLFALSITGVVFLKWNDPQLDATFLGVLITMVMGMAGFLALHFKQQNIEKKMDDVATTAVDAAKELDKATDAKLDKQTEQIATIINEKKDELSTEIKASVPPTM